MEQVEFARNMNEAITISMLSSDPDEAEFWIGYQRGMRRHYHGEKFGTTEEHSLWMSLAEEEHDKQRRYRGLGYRAGYLGLSVSNVLKHSRRE